VQKIHPEKWLRLTVVCGSTAFVSYFMAAFVPFPERISQVLAFAFGPLFMLSSMGLFFVIKAWRDSIHFRIGGLFNIVGTAMITMMLVVQLTIQDFHQQFKAADRGAVSAEQLKWMFKEVNSVQLGMDVTWDIFISIGTFFLALTLFHHPSISKTFSLLGMILSLLLLAFNLIYFPQPPAEVASIDFGPFVAIWYVILMVWLGVKRKSILAATHA